MEWFPDSASETLKRPSSVISSIFSRRHHHRRSPTEKSYLPTVSLAALGSVLLASVGGLAISGLALAGPQGGGGDGYSNSSSSSSTGGGGQGRHDDGHGDADRDRVRAQCVAQGFVLFSSILSTIYTGLHLCASCMGDSLFSAHYWRALSREDEYGRKGAKPTAPSSKAHHFLHPLHAWTVIVARVAFLGWAFALLMAAVAATKKRGPGKEDVQADAVRIPLDVFLSVIAFPAILLSMTIIERASQPFVLPWPLSPRGQDFVSSRVSALGAALDRSVSQREEKTTARSRERRDIPVPAGPRPMTRTGPRAMIMTSRREKEAQAAAAEAAANSNSGQVEAGLCELDCEPRAGGGGGGGGEGGLLGRWMPSWGSAWGSGWGSAWINGLLGGNTRQEEGEGLANQQRQGMHPLQQHPYYYPQQQQQHQQQQQQQQQQHHYSRQSFSPSQYSYPSPRTSPEVPIQTPAPVVYYPPGIQTARSIRIVKNPRITTPSTVRVVPSRPVRDASVVSPQHPPGPPPPPIPPRHSSFPPRAPAALAPAPAPPPQQHRRQYSLQPHPHPPPLSSARPLLLNQRPRNSSCPPDASTRVGPSPLRYVQNCRDSALPRPLNSLGGGGSSSGSGTSSSRSSSSSRYSNSGSSSYSAEEPTAEARCREGYGENATHQVPGAYVEDCTDEEDWCS